MASEVPATSPFDHASTVRRALRSLGVPVDLLDDATQDVFTVVVRRAADFDRDRSLTNWLWGIARGVASTHRRSQRRRARLHGALAVVDSDDDGPERQLARTEAIAKIAAFVDGLPEALRETFVLAHIEGCSGPEIAERLGINLNTAYARIRSTRIRFEAALVDEPRPWTSRVMRAFVPMLMATSKSFTTAATTISLVVIGAGVPPRAGAPVGTVAAARIDAGPADATTRGPRARQRVAAIVMEPLTVESLAFEAAPAVASGVTPRVRTARRVTPAPRNAIALEATVTAAADLDDRPEHPRLRPDGIDVALRDRVEFPSTITWRLDFTPELRRLTDEV